MQGKVACYKGTGNESRLFGPCNKTHFFTFGKELSHPRGRAWFYFSSVFQGLSLLCACYKGTGNESRLCGCLLSSVIYEWVQMY